jgi:hypothetical protein
MQQPMSRTGRATAWQVTLRARGARLVMPEVIGDGLLASFPAASHWLAAAAGRRLAPEGGRPRRPSLRQNHATA